MATIVYQTLKGYVMQTLIFTILAIFGPLIGYVVDVLLLPESIGSFLGFVVFIAWTGSWVILAVCAGLAQGEREREIKRHHAGGES